MLFGVYYYTAMNTTMQFQQGFCNVYNLLNGIKFLNSFKTNIRVTRSQV